MNLIAVIFAAHIVVAFGTTIASAACFDVSKNQPSRLVGHLSQEIFAGAPNYADVQKGDNPELGFILKLRKPICLIGDAFSQPDVLFDEVQLVPSKGAEDDMAALRDTNVQVGLISQMPDRTGRQHRPLVAWVTSISPAGGGTRAVGTAATTVEAFYAALRLGDGSLAARYIVPEKTHKGAFNPQAMTRFYSSLAQPITLINISRISDDRFRVRYRFANGRTVCNGAATVKTTARDGRNFIQSIQTQTGC